MTALSVNLNKIAWLRNAREGSRPDLVDIGNKVLAAGAHGLTVHPRPDQRHIRPADVEALAAVVAAHADIEYNIEGNPTAGPRDNGFPGFDALIESTRPDQCTLVPDSDAQLTSDHGWDLSSDAEVERVGEIVARYQALGARVSLFMDADLEQIGRARLTGADRIELYTGPYADHAQQHGIGAAATNEIRATYLDAARHATQLGLAVNAGHDLNLDNLAHFVAIGDIAEVSIGHALIADALEYGIEATVGKYLAELAAGQ